MPYCAGLARKRLVKASPSIADGAYHPSIATLSHHATTERENAREHAPHKIHSMTDGRGDSCRRPPNDADHCLGAHTDIGCRNDMAVSSRIERRSRRSNVFVCRLRRLRPVQISTRPRSTSPTILRRRDRERVTCSSPRHRIHNGDLISSTEAVGDALPVESRHGPKMAPDIPVTQRPCRQWST